MSSDRDTAANRQRFPLLRIETRAMMQQIGAPSVKHLVPAMVRRA
jgi:hypothetical protein